ncbi:hypothetical protein BLA24_28040 [Streptomyces cinnamoneus]|uniref:DUF397 domain-containing protein n=1 Tax=Streptomyces cinnamoneus TaxID=53446 RepID=A0A2G1XCG8_STRCJ|nr:DUF397 domain-containing protein [Streptomyces cinnamoneus]PHQ48910.1 hypothetical protein BLA24_28040 [Streptomyces cinnamoneus]PPT14441.1 DUF397 domain-containing protein [Streptomyces cinnamoneus]
MTTENGPGRWVWRKSSYCGSGAEGTDDCLEVADDITGLVPVRDSKNPQGPTLVFPASSWAAFLRTHKATESPSP